ncbi:MAG: hypothetical protein FJZ67_12240, partial [Bacteroidetes bacterium]|nr:hypothetical protein [Bacteroidota bacterium]
EKNATFIFIGDSIGLLDKELKQLLDKCAKGSSVLFSSNELGSNITDALFLSYRTGFHFNESATYRFDGKKSLFYGRYQNDTIPIVWNGYKELVQNFGQLDELIRHQRLTTFVRLKQGKSDIFLQSNPEPFTNYQLKHKDGFEHANFVIDQLPINHSIYFVSISQVHFKSEDEATEDEGGVSEQNLLELILSNRILLNTMVLVLIGAIIFVVFRSKRRRAIIPIIQKQHGVTKTFVETIASIFLNKQNPYSLLQIQRKNFYDTILRYYYIDLQRNNEVETLNLLSEKTGYPVEKIQKLLKELRYENQAIGNDYVQQISILQHDFYKHCGIIGREESIVKREFEVNRNIWLSTAIMMFGLTLTFLGLSMLVNSNGIGVLFWIVGFLTLALGIIRILVPHIKINKTEIAYFNQLGRRVKTADAIKINFENNFIKLKINDKEIKINNWDVMKNDLAILKRFIQQTKNL